MCVYVFVFGATKVFKNSGLCQVGWLKKKKETEGSISSPDPQWSQSGLSHCMLIPEKIIPQKWAVGYTFPVSYALELSSK